MTRAKRALGWTEISVGNNEPRPGHKVELILILGVVMPLPRRTASGHQHTYTRAPSVRGRPSNNLSLSLSLSLSLHKKHTRTYTRTQSQTTRVKAQFTVVSLHPHLLHLDCALPVHSHALMPSKESFASELEIVQSEILQRHLHP